METTLRSGRGLRLVLLACVAVLAAALALALAPTSSSAQEFFVPESPEDCDRPGEFYEGGTCNLLIGFSEECPEGYATRGANEDSGQRVCARLAPPPPAVPTTKEQCKEGGFEEFAALGFRNQGECVAFVERGSKS